LVDVLTRESVRGFSVQVFAGVWFHCTIVKI
jgi:hypothetical protein